MSSQSPIFVKTEQLMIWLSQHTRHFPRHERLVLVKQIHETMFSLHESLIRAAVASQTPTKLSHLENADIELNKLRAYIRVSVELTYTKPNQYEYAAQFMTEIGYLLGGWRKKA